MMIGFETATETMQTILGMGILEFEPHDHTDTVVLITHHTDSNTITNTNIKPILIDEG